jgi:integrase
LRWARDHRDKARTGHKNEPEKPKGIGQSFELLANKYFDHHAPALGANQLARNRALLRLHAQPLMRRPANRITRDEVADVLRPIWLGSSNARGVKLRALIERILDSADNERNPATWRRLASLLPARNKKTKRSVRVASLPYGQLPAFYAELAAVGEGLTGTGEKIPRLTACRLLRFLILTGVRLKEARGARWQEIDFDSKLWKIPIGRMKIKDAEEDFEVPLSAEAIGLLREIKDERSNSEFVFGGRWADQCIGQNAIHLALADFERVDERGRSITAHGFRSTFATWGQGAAHP